MWTWIVSQALQMLGFINTEKKQKQKKKTFWILFRNNGKANLSLKREAGWNFRFCPQSESRRRDQNSEVSNSEVHLLVGNLFIPLHILKNSLVPQRIHSGRQPACLLGLTIRSDCSVQSERDACVRFFRLESNQPSHGQTSRWPRFVIVLCSETICHS